jgi:hypothetical protein
MRIVTNNKLARRNRQFATYLFFATMALLVASFFLINQNLFTEERRDPLLMLAQALALPMAFLLTLISVRMTNLWAREPRPEKAIDEGLKGISKKSVLYNYYHIPARHVLIVPQGVFVIVTRWHPGKFSVEGNRWKTHAGAISKFFSSLRMDGVGNPTLDAKRAAEIIERELEDIAPDLEVQPLIVFIDPKAEFDTEDTAVPVLYADTKQKPNLKDYMRDLNRQAEAEGRKRTELPLTQQQIDEFEAKTLDDAQATTAQESN